MSFGLLAEWQFFLIGGCSIASVVIGSLGAFFQLRIKRWVAYSGIVHVGFLLAALTMGMDSSLTCLIFFLSFCLSYYDKYFFYFCFFQSKFG